jgi:hypothetical protein
MGPSDLTTDLGVLTPTTSVGPADGQSPRQETDGKKRHRARPQEEKRESETDDLTLEPGGGPPHQLDDLA